MEVVTVKLRDGPDDKVLPLQVGGPKTDPQNSCLKTKTNKIPQNKKREKKNSKEMDQRLRAPLFLKRTWGLVPNSHTAA